MFRFAPLVVIWMITVTITSGRPAAAPQVNAPSRILLQRSAPTSPAQERLSRDTASTDEAILNRYCATCHNQRVKAAGLTLDLMALAEVSAHAETWEKVIRKIRTGMMPPSGAPRPEPAVLDRLASWVETRLDGAAPPTAHLVTPALHRLNRTEYANAFRDLLSLDIDVESLLPADGSSDGFDNIAQTLAVSPALIQSYVSAALKISRQAVGDRTAPPSQVTFTAKERLMQDLHIEGLPFGTRGGMLIRHTFPLDAEYEFNIGTLGGGRGSVPPPIDFSIDGETIEITNPRTVRVRVKAGPREVGVAIVDRLRNAGVDDVFSDFRVNSTFTPTGGIQTVSILGPYNANSVGDTPSRRRIFVCRPEHVEQEEVCARRILATLARRAYRGPVSEAEVSTLTAFYAEGRAAGDFESGIQQGVARMLVSPRFVYRVVEEPAIVAPGAVYRLSDVELASRLSFFLWSSIPDDELLDVAIQGRLRNPEVLRQQVTRMLADVKSDAFIRNFAGQWLFLRELETVQSDAAHFNENLRDAFKRETELVFGAIVREDRNLLDLLDADYTFVDERLARHYGIPGVRGSHFRRVALAPDGRRRGLLGHGSILTVTSVSNRTSPVVRGKWVLENLLGTPAPIPPPGVESTLDEKKDAQPTSLRQRLEMHRANPACASCHRIMDPMGFALENFDLVGAWRESDGSLPIDASGQLADGTPIRGPVDLRKAIMSRGDAFVTTTTEKLLIYALGRPIHHYDMPVVRSIVRRAARDGNKFSALLFGIIESDSFQKRVKTPASQNAP